MWEFCLYFEKGQIKFINKIKNRLQKVFKRYRGVVILFENENKLLVATGEDESTSIFVYKYLYNYITNIIYTHYKTLELSKIDARLFNNKTFEFIIKQILFCFDEEFDKSIIKQNLILDENLSLQGFYNFKLNELKQKWERLVELIETNSSLLKNYVVNVDLVRFLLSELNPKIESVCLHHDGKKYFLRTIENEKLILDNKNFSQKQSFENMLKNLIFLSPKKIILCFDTKNKDFQIFKDVFAEKLA